MENNKNNKLFKILVSCVVAVNFVLTIVLLCVVVSNKNTSNSNTNNETNIKYTLYVGTNDKDTYEPVADIDTCITKVTEICVNYTSGCTIYQANGYWKDESNAITVEKTIVVILEDVEETIVYSICDDIIKELNQNTVLVEKEGITQEFYSTSK